MPSAAFSDVVGHEKIISILERTAAYPASAYLFSGPDGVGKRTVAWRLARLMLGLAPGVSLDSHPDFVRVMREEGTQELTIKQARELIKRLQLTSAAGGRRVALIEQADRWNEEAANALLKAVEEPPPGVVYIFVSEQVEALPATLRSRLTLLPFGRVAEPKLREWLEGQGITGAQLDRVLEFARGCPGRARRFIEQADELEHAWQQVQTTLEILRTAPLGRVSGELERVSRHLETAEDSEAAWREWLSLAMQDLGRVFRTAPDRAVPLGLGLVHAWKLAGTTLSPRLALEWAHARPYLTSRSIPFFLYPSYL